MYKKWKGCIGKNLNPKFVEDTYITMWNASKKHKHNVAGCSESHLSLMKHIINNKINNVIVIEDDALIDFKRLKELDKVSDFCYIGGRFQPPKLTENLKFDKSKIKKGLHKINTKKFTITGGHGYYLPNVKVTEKYIIIL